MLLEGRGQAWGIALSHRPPAATADRELIPVFIPKGPAPEAASVKVRLGCKGPPLGVTPSKLDPLPDGPVTLLPNPSFLDYSVGLMTGLWGGLGEFWGEPGAEYRTGWLRGRFTLGT